MAALEGALFLAGGSVSLFYGFSRLKKYMLINNTPTSKIRSVAMGLVEIKGSVVAKDTLKTPFSNQDCIYYEYEVREYRRHLNPKGVTNTPGISLVLERRWSPSLFATILEPYM